MAKDRIGNEIKVGSLVSLMVQSQRDPNVLAEVFGNVAAVSAGGITVPGGQRGGDKHALTTPGIVKVRFEIDAYFDPQSGIVAQLMVLSVPAKEGASEQGKPTLIT